jgi:O-succinylbenzoic acid--CoA ligase
MKLTIHSKTYTPEQIPLLISEKCKSEPSEWETALFEFLSQWMDDSNFIQAKTSGSTGIPKTILLNKKSMIASAQLTNRYFNLKENDTVLLNLSTNYIAGKMMIVRAMVGNLHLVAIEPSSYSIVNQPIELAAMVPLQVETMLHSSEGIASLNKISKLIIGGSALSSGLETKLQLISTACYATFGMTETVSHIALRSINGNNRSNRYQALEGVWFEQDERECLIIHALHLQDIPFITNDIVLLESKTSFEWRGRFDHVINSGGVKLFPEILENKIAPVIQQRFFICGQKDEKLGEKAVLIIEGETFSTAALADLKIKLGNALTPYEIPRDIVFIPSFEETSSGKVIRKLV